jgi:hypothetical protein
MVNTLTIPKTLSLETFLALPETKPAQEYFNGHIYQKRFYRTCLAKNKKSMARLMIQ